jgi:hypothetical protein
MFKGIAIGFLITCGLTGLLIGGWVLLKWLFKIWWPL